MFASDLGSGNEEEEIALLNDVVGLQGAEETGPAGPRVKLLDRTEQGLTADNVHIDSSSFVVPILILKSKFGAFFLSDPVLERRELFAKFQTSFYADPQDAVFKALGVE